ncbi:class F sortase [Streptomyces sp. NBC_01465]|uniref:class F sortase n=1 Tax=Streptomyces sp. NBC_01465 TaxID=2903878 RepID=UPI002E35AA30|nr:class F sortase [Streptomyces sp. NBC_01465]
MAEAPKVRRGGRVHHAAALAVTAAVAVTLATGCSSTPSTSTPKTTPVTRTTALSPSVPDHISIPDIKVDADLGTVGLDAKGVMETPPMDKPMQADWYKQGPTPGEKGTSAIVGHMDTAQQPEAVFYNLKKLKKNEQIKVHREDGTTAVFTVDAVDTYKKLDFPTNKVYGSTTHPELRLITCGGSLTEERHWDSNVVVYAHFAGKA